MALAFLYKIVALFDFTAFAIFILFLFFLTHSIANHYKIKRNKNLSKNHFKSINTLHDGISYTDYSDSLFFIIRGAGSDFFHSVFGSNVGYVGYGNAFIIPQGLLILKLILFLAGIIFLFTSTKILFIPPALFICFGSSFALFDCFFSQRNYTHYMLVLIPSLSLLVGLPNLSSRYIVLTNWFSCLIYLRITNYKLLFRHKI